MKFRRLSYFVSILLLFPSCGKSVPEEGDLSVFAVEPKLVNVDANGGRVTVNYSIEGPGIGNLANVECDAFWVSIVKVYNTSFSIRVDANDTGADRTATLLLSCNGVKDKKIPLVQGHGELTPPVFRNFNIEVSGITTSSASVKITPKDASVRYHYSVVRASDLKGMTDQDYIDFMVNEIDRLSAIYGTDPYSFLNLNTCSVPASSLMDDSEYNVMVFDLDYDSEHNPVYSGDIEKKSFRTLRATRDNLELTLKMSGSRLVVSASGSGTYISDVVAAELVEEFESLEDVAREYVKTVRNANYGDISPSLHKGNSSEDYSDYLKEGTRYVAWAVGYRDDDTDGGLTTSVFSIEFTF